MAIVAAEAAGAEGGAAAGGSAAGGSAAGGSGGAGSGAAGGAMSGRVIPPGRKPPMERGTDRPAPRETRTGRPDRTDRTDRSDSAGGQGGGGGQGGRGGAGRLLDSRARPEVSLPSRTYHRVVLAEFVAAVVLVGASPILTPRTKKSGGKVVVDAAFSLAGPLVRLTAVCISFFVLALMASGEKTGKIAAAFGALIVLGCLLNATDMLTVLAKAFGPPPTSGSSGTGKTTPPKVVAA